MNDRQKEKMTARIAMIENYIKTTRAAINEVNGGKLNNALDLAGADLTFALQAIAALKKEMNID